MSVAIQSMRKNLSLTVSLSLDSIPYIKLKIKAVKNEWKMHQYINMVTQKILLMRYTWYTSYTVT
jgi:hypothetical protein